MPGPKKKTNSARSDARAEWLARAPEEVLQCRDVGHRWADWTVTWDRQRRAFHQTLRCECCTAERIRYVTETGELLPGHYRYPDGYLVPEDVDARSAAGRAALRLAHVRRYVPRPGAAAPAPVTPLRRRRHTA